MKLEDLHAGQTLRISRAASVQFAACEPFAFRLIRGYAYGSTPTGCAWIDGYQLDTSGKAVEHRQLFVQLDGLTLLRPPATRADNRARIVRAADRNNRPTAAVARIPRPRTPSEPTTGRNR